MGCFFGLKLHLVINNEGQLIAFKITKGNVNDVKAAYPLLSKLKRLAFVDKGYIGKKLSEKLMESALKLITRKRKHMRRIQSLLLRWKSSYLINAVLLKLFLIT